MKKLIALISTQGKSKEQIVKETVGAFQKYRSVEEKVRSTAKGGLKSGVKAKKR